MAFFPQMKGGWVEFFPRISHAWFFVLLYIGGMAVYLLRLYIRERDKRKLTVAIAFFLAAAAFSGLAFGFMEAGRDPPQIWRNIFNLFSMPLLLPVVVMAHERFIRIDNYNRVFGVFIGTAVVCLLLAFLPYDYSFVTNFVRQIVTLELLAVSIFMFIKTRAIDYLYFMLFLGCSGIAGISYPLATYLSPFAFWVSYIFLTLIIFVSTPTELSAYFLQKELKSIEAKYEKLFNILSDRAMLIDAEGTIVEVNDAQAKSVAEPKKKIIGKKVEEVWCECCTEVMLYTYQLALETGSIQTVQSLDQGLHFDNTFIASKGPHGKRAILHLSRDITGQKNAEEQLRQKTIKAGELAKSAKSASNAKSEFLANMSHEIRTPMNAVIGMTDLLAGTELTEQQLGHLDGIKNSGESLLQLINDILDFSRIEAGKLDIQLSYFNLSELLRNLERDMGFRVVQSGVSLTCCIEKDVPIHLKGDARRLRQILANLVSNAFKFTKHGAITVGCQVLDKTDREVQLRFGVSDTGIGISEEYQKIVFDSFTQGDSSITREYGGTGLGLAISKQLCELMDGQIGVNSTPGEETEFWFRIQVILAQKDDIEDSTKRKMSDSISTEVSIKKKRILLAEDNATNRGVALAMLKRLGYRADAAVDGQEVLRVLESQSYDLLLMDIQMPVLDGLSATKAIRESLREYRKIPIIAITANAIIGDREKCLDAGMDDYISKPIHLDTLERIIGKWI